MNLYVKVVLVAAISALVAYLAFPIFGMNGLSARTNLVLGVVAGAVLGVLLSNLDKIFAAANLVEQTVFVGNLPFKVSEEQVRKLFAQYGEVKSVRLMIDRATRRPRGYGFVQMTRAGARAAIKGLDGTELGGRNLKVSTAHGRKPKSENSD